MPTEEWLNDQIRQAGKQISRLKNDITDAQSENAILHEKIAKLKAAKAHAENAKEDALSLWKDLRDVRSDCWEGANWDKFESAAHEGGHAHYSVKALHKRCEELEDKIQSEIISAHMRINYFAEIISKAQTAIGRTGSEIQSWMKQLSRM